MTEDLLPTCPDPAPVDVEAALAAAKLLEDEAKVRAAEKEELEALRKERPMLIQANRRLAARLAQTRARLTREAAEIDEALGLFGNPG